MADISVTFKNNYGESRRWGIVDMGRDPNSPPVIFGGYLEPDQATSPLALYSADGIYGQAAYQRSDGPQQTVDVTANDVVSME